MRRPGQERSQAGHLQPALKHGHSGGPPHPPLPPVALAGLLAVGVALIVLLAHWPCLSARALSFDDTQYMTENQLGAMSRCPSGLCFLIQQEYGRSIDEVKQRV